MLALCHDWTKVSLMKRKKEDYRQVAFHGWIQEGGWGWMSSTKSHSSSRSAKKLSTSSCSSKPSRKSKQFMNDSFYFLKFTDFVAALNLVQLFSTLLGDQCMPANSCIYYTRASCLWIKNISLSMSSKLSKRLHESLAVFINGWWNFQYNAIPYKLCFKMVTQ